MPPRLMVRKQMAIAPAALVTSLLSACNKANCSLQVRAGPVLLMIILHIGKCSSFELMAEGSQAQTATILIEKSCLTGKSSDETSVFPNSTLQFSSMRSKDWTLKTVTVIETLSS